MRYRDYLIFGLGATIGAIAVGYDSFLVSVALGALAGVIIALVEWLLGRDWRLRRQP